MKLLFHIGLCHLLMTYYPILLHAKVVPLLFHDPQLPRHCLNGVPLKSAFLMCLYQLLSVTLRSPVLIYMRKLVRSRFPSR
ncbi:hypothetical protein RIR_jg7534.t1 [Rhizophagus irregularis DAOM 181602=DAOM 197198]|uniref:Uncharacterized protein n=1 Tax=Rhizophagus irregularis (strain DAOM 197198w) TaxID=1432141 RepID=A0A015JS14_RHIIW|nr:hypothetical protein RirG_070080 [Rhizophagus irregularis DAOM 197198w]GET64668.1 hypothetical protein RIR_jg7534.t1 [Rhizophagus irregularis DAOM 181602=DAOM 197198]